MAKWPPSVVSSQDTCELVQKFLPLSYLLRLFRLQEEKRFGKKTWHRNVKMMGEMLMNLTWGSVKKYKDFCQMTWQWGTVPTPLNPAEAIHGNRLEGLGTALPLFSFFHTQMGENSNRGPITWWAMTRSFIHVWWPSCPHTPKPFVPPTYFHKYFHATRRSYKASRV